MEFVQFWFVKDVLGSVPLLLVLNLPLPVLSKTRFLTFLLRNEGRAEV